MSDTPISTSDNQDNGAPEDARKDSLIEYPSQFPIKVMGVHDDGRIVWDEFAGQSITFLPVLYLGQMNWLWLLLGFILFRIFDVWKPWPIRVIDQKVEGGFGIMLDDLIAGLWAALCIWIYFYFTVA